jgi:DNA-binding LacI/PurR family transcriptional regulator
MKNPSKKFPERELRHQKLKQELGRLIKKGSPGDMLPSYTEMIRMFGVGQNTIDRVIREFDNSGLIIRKAGTGIFISPRASRKNIGFVLGRDIFSGGQSPICAMLMNQCRLRAQLGLEYFKFYVDLPESIGTKIDVPLHQELADDIQNGRLDGVILVWSYGPAETEWIHSHGIPIVSLGADGDIDSHNVIIDYSNMIDVGVSALAAEGAKSIALLSSSSWMRSFGYRRDIEIFQKALTEAGLKFDPQFVLDDNINRSLNGGGSMSNEDLGFALMSEFLSSRRIQGSSDLPIDGLLSEDDMFTRGALSALHLSGVGVSDRLLIATHANKGSPALRNYENHLILLEIDPKEIIDAMFQILNPMMDDADSTPQRVVIQAHPRRRG